MSSNTISSAALVHHIKKGIPRDAKETQGSKISNLVSTKDDSIDRAAFPPFQIYLAGVDTVPWPNATSAWAALHGFRALWGHRGPKKSRSWTRIC